MSVTDPSASTPLELEWAGRAGWAVESGDDRVQFFTDTGRLERSRSERDGLARLEERDMSPPSPPVLLIEAADPDDVARYLLADFAQAWLNDALRTPVRFDRADPIDAAAAFHVEERGQDSVLLEPGGGVRARFGGGSRGRATAARFGRWTDLPPAELSARFERAGRAAMEAERLGRPVGTSRRIGHGLRRTRLVLV